MLDPKVPPGKAQSMPVPSPYWGDKLYWYDPAITNHAAMDGKGRVWMSSRFRLPENQPAFCATHPSAALAPQKSSFRQVQYFDPKTRQFKQVNICFDTHHVQFAADKDETLYGNGVFSGAIGWINTRILDETGDEADGAGLVPRLSRSESGRQGRSGRRSSDRRERDLQRHSASERRQRLGRGARPDAGQDHPHRSARRASAKRTSRRSIPRRASSATRRAASTSTRTA